MEVKDAAVLQQAPFDEFTPPFVSIATFSNGELAGTHRGVYIPWDMDISNQLQPGRIDVTHAVFGTLLGFEPLRLITLMVLGAMTGSSERTRATRFSTKRSALLDSHPSSQRRE